MKRLVPFSMVLLLLLAFLILNACLKPTATAPPVSPPVSLTPITPAITPISPSPSITNSPQTTALSPSTPPTTVKKLDNIRLLGTIGPLTIPLAYMVENNSLSAVANKTTLDTWATPAQLQAMVTGTQADFISLPSNGAATFYNKGVKLQYLDNSIWNILYIVTPDTGIRTVTDLKGKKVVVPYQNAVPDAMFQSLCQQYGMDLTKDINIFYSPDPIQASQLLLTGTERYVLLSEPSATSVILKGESSGLKFVRAINFGAAWKEPWDSKPITPVAGTVVLGELLNKPEVVKVFMTEYAKALDWMLANPEKAGEVGARALAQQGFTAPVLTASLKNVEWRFVTAQDARSSLEIFFTTLARVSPNFIGGKLPDDGFYFKP